MSALLVHEPGMLTSVQDLGRPGWAAIGAPEGGAADSLSLRIGNRLVGNTDAAPALEMTLVGGTFEFEKAVTVALTGGETCAEIRGRDRAARPAPAWSAFEIGAGESLRIGPVVRRARVYLCIAGGLKIAPTLGGASTHLGAGFGGHEGRALRKGDRLEMHDPANAREPRTLSDRALRLAESTLARRTIRATPGAHAHCFNPRDAESFWASSFAVSSESDRVGVRLLVRGRGPAIGAAMEGRMPSEGMPHGGVQVPQGGEPIVLMVDHPTTGGYPVLACVATLDLPALGQLRPHDALRFEQVSVEEARRMHHEFTSALDAEIPLR